MSYDAKDDADSERQSSKILLRTADQYHLWFARISGAVWAETRLELSTIKDIDCTKATNDYITARNEGKAVTDWVGKAWSTITRAIHNELFLKLIHIPQGRIASLLNEVRSALSVNSAEEVPSLRLELYAASMATHCGADLQT